MTTLSPYSSAPRRGWARASRLNGLDYLEVSPDQRTLTVHLMRRLSKRHFRLLSGDRGTRHVVIEGGRVIRDVRVTEVQAERGEPGEDDRLIVTVNRPGDFSPYTLRVATVDEWGRPAAEPLAGFDPRYARLPFSFKIDCARDVDCKPVAEGESRPAPQPLIDYLAKDYGSFRRVILDRLATIMPDWAERHPADVGIAITELLAYVGDHLSYYQDAVATEAYLGTARQRISARRHLRLIDYRLHEGCNARTFVHVAVSESDDPLKVSRGIRFEAAVPPPIDVGRETPPIVFEPIFLDRQSPDLLPGDLKYPAALIWKLQHSKDEGPRYLRGRLSADVRGMLDALKPEESPSANLVERLRADLNRFLRHPLPRRGRRALPKEIRDALGGSDSAERRWQARKALERWFPAEIACASRDADPAQFWHGHNAISFHLWGDEPFVLPAGATSTTLRDEWLDASPAADGGRGQAAARQRSPQTEQTVALIRPRKLGNLSPGDLLIFEECRSARTGLEVDRDPTRRHVVRLTHVEFDIDPAAGRIGDSAHQVGPQPIVHITWAAEDALPLTFCLAAVGPAENGCSWVTDITMARGNIVLADHGRSVPQRVELGTVARADVEQSCRGPGRPSDVVPRAADFAPVLPDAPLTFAAPVEPAVSAGRLLVQEPTSARPALRVWSIPPNADGTAPAFSPAQLEKSPPPDAPARRLGPPAHASAAWARQVSQALCDQSAAKGSGQQTDAVVREDTLRRWSPQPDLLDSLADDRHVMVENDNDGRSHLRFGDGEFGRHPEAGEAFLASYRIGNGPAGNVPAESICRMFQGTTLLPVCVRNPLPAVGGASREPVAEVRLSGLDVHGAELVRAVTPEDYDRLIERHFADRVQRSATVFRQTGTWTEVLVAVDPRGTFDLDDRLRAEIAAVLDRYRLIGHELHIEPGRAVPLRLAMQVTVRPGFESARVKSELLAIFSNRALPGGKRGFFHADNLTFGQGIALSAVVAAARAVPGVADVTVTTFRRLDDPAPSPNAAAKPPGGDSSPAVDEAIATGILTMGALEIPRLDNDPDFPAHGELEIEGR